MGYFYRLWVESSNHLDTELNIGYLTHIDNGGFVTDFTGALFCLTARNASPSGKIEPR